MNMKVIPQAINQRNIIKFQAWADSHVNFPYLVRAPLSSAPDVIGAIRVNIVFRYFESVAECIVQDLQYDNLNCDLEKMKSDMSNVFSEWSGVHSWNYHDYCEGGLKLRSKVSYHVLRLSSIIYIHL